MEIWKDSSSLARRWTIFSITRTCQPSWIPCVKKEGYRLTAVHKVAAWKFPSFMRPAKGIQDGSQWPRTVWVRTWEIAYCILFIDLSHQKHSFLSHSPPPPPRSALSLHPGLLSTRNTTHIFHSDGPAWRAGGMIGRFPSRDITMTFCHWTAGPVGTSGGEALFPSHSVMVHWHSSVLHIKLLHVAEAGKIQNAWLRNPSECFRGQAGEGETDLSRLFCNKPPKDKGFYKRGDAGWSRMEMWTQGGSGAYVSLQEKWWKLWGWQSRLR